jgi:hypothetical protein
MLTKVFNLFSCNYEKNCLRILDKLFFLYFTLLTCRVCCTYFFHIHSNFLKFCRLQLHFFPLIHIHFLTSFTFHTLSNCFTFFLAFFIFHTFLDYFTNLLQASFILYHEILKVFIYCNSFNSCCFVDAKTIEPMFSCWQWFNGVHGRLLGVWMHLFCQAMKNAIILHQHGLSYNFVDELKVGN